MSNCKKFDANNYEFNTNSKKGVYIIHGFTNTTYETKDLAIFLSEHGYNTVANNLPGHGTTIEDCNKCKYTDWIEFVEKDLAELSSSCDKIYVIGISMGSVLAMYLCSFFPINAAVFAAPVLEFKDHIGTRYLAPLLHKIIRTRAKGLSYPKELRKKMYFFGYPKWPMSGVNEFRKLTNLVKKKLSLINSPTLIIKSRQDKLQLPLNNSLVFNSISSRIKENFIVENAGHNLFADSIDQEIIFNKVVNFLKDN